MLAYAGLEDGLEDARMYGMWYKGSLMRCNGCWRAIVGGRPGEMMHREPMRGGLDSATPRSCVVAMVTYTALMHFVRTTVGWFGYVLCE